MIKKQISCNKLSNRLRSSRASSFSQGLVPGTVIASILTGEDDISAIIVKVDPYKKDGSKKNSDEIVSEYTKEMTRRLRKMKAKNEVP